MPAPAQSTMRNVVEVMWEDLPGHFAGAYSKMLVRPERLGSRSMDYRISTYQPKAYRSAALPPGAGTGLP